MYVYVYYIEIYLYIFTNRHLLRNYVPYIQMKEN